MMIIYNDHTCSSYMIMIYVVSSSIKRLIWSWFIHFSIFRMCYCPFVDSTWKQNKQIFRFHDWHFNHASCTSERLLQRQILLQSSSVPFLRHLWKAAAACTIPGWMDMCWLWNFMRASKRKVFFAMLNNFWKSSGNLLGQFSWACNNSFPYFMRLLQGFVLEVGLIQVFFYGHMVLVNIFFYNIQSNPSW